MATLMTLDKPTLHCKQYFICTNLNRVLQNYNLWPYALAITSNGRVGLWFCGFIPRSTRRLTGSGFDFKASQKKAPQLKVLSDRL